MISRKIWVTWKILNFHTVWVIWYLPTLLFRYLPDPIFLIWSIWQKSWEWNLSSFLWVPMRSNLSNCKKVRKCIRNVFSFFLRHLRNGQADYKSYVREPKCLSKSAKKRSGFRTTFSGLVAYLFKKSMNDFKNVRWIIQ